MWGRVEEFKNSGALLVNFVFVLSQHRMGNKGMSLRRSEGWGSLVAPHEEEEGGRRYIYTRPKKEEGMDEEGFRRGWFG